MIQEFVKDIKERKCSVPLSENVFRSISLLSRKTILFSKRSKVLRDNVKFGPQFHTQVDLYYDKYSIEVLIDSSSKNTIRSYIVIKSGVDGYVTDIVDRIQAVQLLRRGICADRMFQYRSVVKKHRTSSSKVNT